MFLISTYAKRVPLSDVLKYQHISCDMLAAVNFVAASKEIDVITKWTKKSMEQNRQLVSLGHHKYYQTHTTQFTSWYSSEIRNYYSHTIL